MTNLTLNVKNVHVRYEDETYPYLHPFSFGVCLESATVKTVNGEWVLGD